MLEHFYQKRRQVYVLFIVLLNWLLGVSVLAYV